MSYKAPGPVRALLELSDKLLSCDESEGPELAHVALSVFETAANPLPIRKLVLGRQLYEAESDLQREIGIEEPWEPRRIRTANRVLLLATLLARGFQAAEAV